MKWFQKRRVISTAILVIAAAALVVTCKALDTALQPAATYTGIFLLAILLFLTLFNARKKLPFLPLFRASTWMQIHIYVGLFSVVLFLVHIQFRIPRGNLEIILAAVFVIVTLSGIIGLVLSRILPPIMTSHGDSIVYEKIPATRYRLQKEAEGIVLETEAELQSSSLTDFYLQYLRPFLHRGPGTFLALIPEKMRTRELENQMTSISRYLATQERPVLDEFREIVETKRNLDHQQSAQRLLKLWLFMHIPFTYSLLILSFVHGFLALKFSGRI